MSDYTPTTEQVRDGYRYDPEAEYHDPVTPHHVTSGRAFDRWYAAEVRKAKAEAWEAGYNACHEDCQRKTGPLLTPNPHRRGDDE